MRSHNLERELNVASTKSADHAVAAGFPVATVSSFREPEHVSQRDRASTSVQSARLPSKADLIAETVLAAVDSASEVSAKPANAAIATVTKLVAALPEGIIGEPDVDLFYGEIHLQWSNGNREVMLTTFSGDREPLVHDYKRISGRITNHTIEKATPESLAKWLRRLNA